MITGTETIAAAAAPNPRMGDIEELLQIARDGDLHHIDGPLITALAELARWGTTEYRGHRIRRQAGEFAIDGAEVIDCPIFALLEAERMNARQRLAPLTLRAAS